MAAFDGYLIAWDGFKDAAKMKYDEQFLEVLGRVPGLRPQIDRVGKKWRFYTLRSKVSLLDDRLSLSGKELEYPVVFRVNRETGNIIVAAESKDVAEHLVGHLLNAHILPRVRKIGINVRNLTRHVLVENDQAYAITALYAHTPSFGSNLKTVMLYGDDLGQSEILLSNIETFDSFQIGLRSRQSSRESARLGSDGYLRFYERGRGNFAELERCLAFVNNLNLYVR